MKLIFHKFGFLSQLPSSHIHVENQLLERRVATFIKAPHLPCCHPLLLPHPLHPLHPFLLHPGQRPPNPIHLEPQPFAEFHVSSFFERLLPLGKLTCPPKRDHPKRKFYLPTTIFQGAFVSFQGQ